MGGDAARLLVGWPLTLVPGGGVVAAQSVREGALLLHAPAYAAVIDEAWAPRVCVACARVARRRHTLPCEVRARLNRACVRVHRSRHARR
jgi:hypothetical protein